MAYQVLARKYRPQRFSEVIGQEHVTRTLKNAIEQGRIASGYIFSGHRGIGKTTIARILAMALNCRSSDKPVTEPCGICESCIEVRAGNSVDVIEIDAATNRGIDEIRELRDAARYRPARDRYKIWILDEAHQITDAAFNALLKTLEEPPSHVIFMLATTAPEDIPQTIRSRCQHFSFHAVRFDDILGQLKDLAGRENIKFEPDALALLAEAGDGSVRDALSILDQAIACCGDMLTAETVRQLVGTVPSATLETIMQAVERGSSEEVLRLVDKLISEGQNPTHFARQLVRFLRNSVVAKVAGKDTGLLQISTDERDRVARIAELFSEEDLARFLQIMLRTHGELGYRQEQRLHLELGLLKMAHATRLLPIEQLLSESAAPASSVRSAMASSAPNTPERRTGASDADRGSARVSPFAADSARKSSGPKLLSDERVSAQAGNASRAGVVTSGPAIMMGAAAPAMAAVPETNVVPGALQEKIPAPQAKSGLSPQIDAAQADAVESKPDHDMDLLRTAVVTALENAGHRMLAGMLDTGEWQVRGNELLIKVAAAESVVDMAFGAEQKRLSAAAASHAAGRPLKIRVSGGAANANVRPRSTTVSGNGTDARSRAANDRVVRRVQEKFGAEIRTVIDQSNKR